MDYLLSYGPEGIADLKEGHSLVLESTKAIVELTKEIKKVGLDRLYVKSLEDAIKKTDELAVKQMKLASVTEYTSRTILNTEKARTQQVKTDREVVKLIDDEERHTIRLRREKERQERATRDLTDAYRQLVKEQKQLEGQARVLYVTMGKTSAQYQEAKNRSNELKRKLNEVNEDLLVYNHNVGNYKSSWQGLNQILREVPNAGINAQTFLMSISNNIAQLADDFKAAQQRNAELIASGKQAIPVWKQLAVQLISFQTALNVAVALLVAFGPRIMDFIFNTKKAAEANFDLAASLHQVNEEMSENQRRIDRLTKLRVAEARAAGKSDKEITQIQKEGLDQRLELIDAEISKTIESISYYESLRRQMEAGMKFDGIKDVKEVIDAIEDLRKKQAELSQDRADTMADKDILGFDLDYKERQKATKELARDTKERIRIMENFYEEVAKLRAQFRNGDPDNDFGFADEITRYSQGDTGVVIPVYLRVSQEQTNRELQKLDESLNQELKGIETSYQMGLYKSYESYEKAKYDTQVRYAQLRVKAEIDGLKRASTFLQDGSKEKLDILTKINELELRAAKDLNEKKLESDKEYVKKKKELLQELKAAEKSLRDDIITGIQTVISAFVQGELNQTDIQRQEAQKRADKQKNDVDKELLTEEQRAAKKAAIEERLQQELETIDKSRKRLVRQQAIIEKTASLLRIGVNTLEKVAAIKAQAAVLASNPATAALSALALAQIPFVLTSGALAAAGVAATPLPAYKDGVEDHPFDGPAILGDGFERELVVEPGKKPYWSSDKPTIYNLRRHTMVLNQDQLKDGARKAVIRELMFGHNTAEQEFLMRQFLKQGERQTNILKQIASKKSVNKVQVQNYSSFRDYIIKSI